MIKDKKAFMKTVEVVIAIVISFIVLMYIVPQRNAATKDETISLLPALDKNEIFRSCVIAGNLTCVNQTLDANIEDRFGYSFTVNADPNIAAPNRPNKKIFADSVYIAGNNTFYSPKIVRLYYWAK